MWGALLKKPQLAWVLAVVLALSFVQVPRAYSADLAFFQEKALVFIRDVVGLDVTKYRQASVTVSGTPTEKSVQYNLVHWQDIESSESGVSVGCYFSNDALVQCLMSVSGSPIFVQPTTDSLVAAKNFLERYQTFSKASYLQQIRDMLNAVTELKPMTTTVDNVKLTIKFTINPDPVEDYLEIKWMNMVNGIENTYNNVILAMFGGTLYQLYDYWNHYPIGSSNVSISKEQAINIAKQSIPNIHFKFVVDKPEFTFAGLTMQLRENALYPHWEIVLPIWIIDVPQSMLSVRVKLWADTGEVYDVTNPSPFRGRPDGENSTVPSIEPTPTEPAPSQQQGFLGSKLPLEYGYAVVTVIAVAMAAAAFLVYFRKIKKTRGKAEKIGPEEVT